MTFALNKDDRRVHVFSLSDGTLELAHQTYLSQLSGEAEGMPLAQAFGAPIDTTYAEVFAVRDVEPMGLRAYLAQAQDIPEDALAKDAARLDALSGDVVVLSPRAVEGLDSLAPRPELTHIGSYAQAEANNTPIDLPRAVKVPGDAVPETANVPSSPSRRRIAVIVIAALLVAGALVFLL